MAINYPFFQDSFNTKLEWMAWINIAFISALITLNVLVEAEVIEGGTYELHGLAALAGLPIFILILSTFVFWGAMWTFWVRYARSPISFCVLLFGPYGGTLIYYYFVYRREWNRKIHLLQSIEQEKARMQAQ